jgi:hypothetical protein
MCDQEIEENIKNILDSYDKIKQENQDLKAALRKVLDSIKSIYAQCNVDREAIDQYGVTADISLAIRGRLVDRISFAMLERINEISSITIQPSTWYDTVTYGVKINLINNTALEQLVRLLGEEEEK